MTPAQHALAAKVGWDTSSSASVEVIPSYGS